ncbi:MAG: hypothetical protein VKO64_07795 [Candidatus Sericytochromatia bacterium]|nr:hypothetical protein [Candidatus Sericytochromatia bacterium]
MGENSPVSADNLPMNIRVCRFLGLMSLAVGVLVPGCGKVDVATQVPVGGGLPSGYRQPSQAAPVQAPVAYPGTSPIAAPPATTPVATPVMPMPRLLAAVSKFDNGVVFGLLGTKVAHVELRNPTQVPLRATVKVQFTDNGAPLADRVQTRAVEVAPGSVQTVQFTEKYWKIDGATVTVADEMSSGGASLQAPVPGMPSGYPGY